MSWHSATVTKASAPYLLRNTEKRTASGLLPISEFTVLLVSQVGKAPDDESTVVKKQLATANPPTCL